MKSLFGPRAVWFSYVLAVLSMATLALAGFSVAEQSRLTPREHLIQATGARYPWNAKVTTALENRDSLTLSVQLGLIEKKLDALLRLKGIDPAKVGTRAAELRKLSR